MDVTTVADDLIVCHDGPEVIRLGGLAPGSTHEVRGTRITTLDSPGGMLVCRLATVNDLHFGEVECGRIDDDPQGPIQRPLPGEPPYPQMMNAGAIAEINALEPAAVIVKGDLTNDGLPAEFTAFDESYGLTFGERLHVVRGNHDGYKGQSIHSGDRWIELPGVAVALLDTVIATQTTGMFTETQAEWLDAHAAASSVPVLVMGHHQQWVAEPDGHRSEGYFGLHPDASDRLDALFARRPSLLAYAAGHTHRHRVRRMTSGAPTIEIGCVKDFPGTWAEYRVYEAGIMQVVHRISTPTALVWSERCRHLYSDFGVDYESYALGRLEDRCFTIPLR